MNSARALLQRLAAEPGQTMAEYAIVLGVIAVIVLVAAVLLGGNISSVFGRVSRSL